MKFISQFRNAIYSKDYIATFAENTFGKVVLYLFLLGLIGSAIITVLLLPPIVAEIPAFSTGNFITTYYPSALQIDITNGVVATNVAQPYFISVPTNDGGSAASDTPKNLLVIDTTATDTVQALETYQTAALLTSNELVVKKNTGEIQIIPLDKVTKFHLDQQVALEFFKKSLPFLYAGGVILVILIPFLLSALWTLGQLFFMLVLAFIVWIVAKVRKIKLGYKKSYVLSGYLLTVPAVIGFVCGLFHITDPLIVTVLLFAVAAIVNVKQREYHDV
jgi:hypothetical protein